MSPRLLARKLLGRLLGKLLTGLGQLLGGLLEIEGFNGWYRGEDPSYLLQQMLTSINAPIRIGRATVLPGDVVLANRHGTIFIPSHLLAEAASFFCSFSIKSQLNTCCRS